MSAGKLGLAITLVALILIAGGSVHAETATAVYGENMMTAQEREQHRERIRAAETDEERNRIRDEHRKRMQDRARERNVQLPGAVGSGQGAGPIGDKAGRDDSLIRGRELMTKEERERHREQMRSLRTKEEREQLRKAKHEEMKKRAAEEGRTIPDEPMPRGRGMGQGAGGGRR